VSGAIAETAGVSFLVAYVAMVVIALLAVLGARRALPRRTLLFLAGSAAIGPLAAILHNVVGALLGREEAVFFIIAVVLAPIAFAIAAIAGATSLLRDGRHTDLAAALVIGGSAILLLPLNAGDPGWVFIALSFAIALGSWDVVRVRAELAGP